MGLLRKITAILKEEWFDTFLLLMNGWLDLQFSSRPLDSNSSLLLVEFFGIESIKRRGIKNEVICDEDDDDEVESKRRRSNFRADLMLLHEKNELRKNAAGAALQNSDLWKWSFSGGPSFRAKVQNDFNMHAKYYMKEIRMTLFHFLPKLNVSDWIFREITFCLKFPNVNLLDLQHDCKSRPSTYYGSCQNTYRASIVCSLECTTISVL